VAEEQQVMANADAASRAQTTADQGVVSAAAAQTSANQAQSTADQGVLAAQAAGVAAAADATAVQTVNQRVSDLANYTTVAVDSVYFPVNGSTLDADGKAGLDKLASFIASATGYRIEIAGYASSSGTSEYNQRLSEERAASVVHYLTEVGNVPVQQIVLPAGYGATHPVADNTVRDGRALNQRVEVKVLVNKGLQEGSPVTAALLN
jgi:outer membrane protein OmpA-like peptidoglycan-associated protein